MRIRKRFVLRVFFVFEIIGFSYLYVFGAHGMRAVYALQKENDALATTIAQLHHELDQLKSEVTVWSESSFLKEKLAREQLQMARDGEEIYYTNL